MYLEPQIWKQPKQTLKPATHCLGACALTSQAMLASKMMLDCGSDNSKSVLVVALIEPFKGCATQKWRGVKSSKKAARSLRTRTSGRSASHAGRGETRLRAADCLGAAALYTSCASGKLPSCLFLSAFICVHLRLIWGFDFRVGPEEKHIWPQMNADERG